ncbi:MAG: HAD-IA family hydrolase [Actinomycetota bacterium]|nr:HAD-IA family hydrolase [Actinomycetota bacterium]
MAVIASILSQERASTTRPAGRAEWTIMVLAVCLDVMGTVLYDPYVEALEAATGLEIGQLQALADPATWPAFEIGAIDEAEFVRRFFTDPDRFFDAAELHRVRLAGYRFLPGMRDLLHAVEGRLERYAASNYPVWIEELVATFDFSSCFDGVYASHHLRARKPDPLFFELLLAEIGREAADCLFVDDRAVNCQAAETVGMRAHHFTSAEDLSRRLRAEGVEVG